MSFGFRHPSASASYSHFVPAFEKGTVDMTKYNGGIYNTPFNEIGIRQIRHFFISVGIDEQKLSTHSFNEIEKIKTNLSNIYFQNTINLLPFIDQYSYN